MTAISNTFASHPSIKTTLESAVNPGNELRTDIAITFEGSRHFYDIKIVAINAASAREYAQDTLSAAARQKALKYKELGPLLHPIVISAGGLWRNRPSKTSKTFRS